MTKNEFKKLAIAKVYINNGLMNIGASSLASLIMSAKSTETKYQLVQIAKMHNLLAHPDFKCGFQIIN
jgi:hypothetical protein